MTTKTLVLFLFLIIMVGTAGYFLLRGSARGPEAGGEPQQTACTQDAKLCFDGTALGRQGPKCQFSRCPDGLELYANPTHGISFGYPDTYEITEREAGNTERSHYAITLIDKDDAAQIPENGEGPAAITVDIFQNTIDKQTVEAWIKNSSFSNFKLSPDGNLEESTVADKEAFSYAWDGLYRGDSVVFAHRDNIVMLSVTYLDRDDKIRKDFKDLLTRVRLEGVGNSGSNATSTGE